MSSEVIDCSSAIVNQRSNPDISGVGIRISFYLQNFVLVLLVNRSWEDAPNSLWTFIATNFGLTVAALAQLDNDRLTLFEAIEVSYLVWLANCGTVLALASYSGQKEEYKRRRAGDTTAARPKHDNFVMVGAVVQTFFSMILTLVMWVKAAEIGKLPEQECDNEHIQFVFFAAPVHALTTGRIISLLFASVVFISYTYMTIREINSSRRAIKAFNALCNLILGRPLTKGLEEQLIDTQPEDLQMTQASGRPGSSGSSQRQRPAPQQAPSSFLAVPALPIQQTPSASSSSTVTKSNRDDNNAASGHQKKKDRSKSGSKMKSRLLQHAAQTKARKSWVTFDKTLVGTLAIQLLVFTYFIVCNELYINVYNSSDGENGQWGFGQVFALIVIIPSVVSVVRAFKKHGLSRLDRLGRERTKPTVSVSAA